MDPTKQDEERIESATSESDGELARSLKTKSQTDPKANEKKRHSSGQG
jgi:hypothetical protein